MLFLDLNLLFELFGIVNFIDRHEFFWNFLSLLSRCFLSLFLQYRFLLLRFRSNNHRLQIWIIQPNISFHSLFFLSSQSLLSILSLQIILYSLLLPLLLSFSLCFLLQLLPLFLSSNLLFFSLLGFFLQSLLLFPLLILFSHLRHKTP